MTDEIERTINALRIVADTQQRHEDRYGAWNFLRRTANLLEKLTAENDHFVEVAKKVEANRDHWKARCESAERDMKTLADELNWIDKELPCALCLNYKTICCHSRDDCFQWHGTQEEENNE